MRPRSRQRRPNAPVMSPVPLAGPRGARLALYDRRMASSDSERTAAALVGRDRECAAIGRLIDASADGASSTLVLRGEAGIEQQVMKNMQQMQGG